MKLANSKLLTLRLPPFNRVHITLVGVGGTGSHIASGLAAIALDLHERGIRTSIVFVDSDIVEAKNVGRQLFAKSDLGKPKAEIVTERLNAAYDLAIGASVRAIDDLDTFIAPDALSIVIGAVDNPAARAVIAKKVKQADGRLWVIDSGNESYSGQVFIGNSNISQMKNAVSLGMTNRIPSPYAVCPDLIKTAIKSKRVKRDPSCAELTANDEQSLMINRMMAAYTLSMLNDFLLGRLCYFGVWIDLRYGGVRNCVLDISTLCELTTMKKAQLIKG